MELPGSNPVVFEAGRSIGTALIAWPVEQVVKCLVPFHPDDDVGNRLENEAQVKALYDAVQASGHELLIEIVPPKRLPKEPDILLRAMKRLYNLGIYPEWWKLPPPSAGQWPAIDALDRRARSLLSRRRAAGLERADRHARARLRRGCGQPIMPRLCRGAHDLPRSGAGVARGRHRRRRARHRGAGEFRSVDRRVDRSAIDAATERIAMTTRDSPSAKASAVRQFAFACSRSLGAHGHLVDAAVKLVDGEGAFDWIHGSLSKVTQHFVALHHCNIGMRPQ